MERKKKWVRGPQKMSEKIPLGDLLRPSTLHRVRHPGQLVDRSMGRPASEAQPFLQIFLDHEPKFDYLSTIYTGLLLHFSQRTVTFKAALRQARQKPLSVYSLESVMLYNTMIVYLTFS